jgi:hypothetical protein
MVDGSYGVVDFVIGFPRAPCSAHQGTYEMKLDFCFPSLPSTFIPPHLPLTITVKVSPLAVAIPTIKPETDTDSNSESEGFHTPKSSTSSDSFHTGLLTPSSTNEHSAHPEIVNTTTLNVPVFQRQTPIPILNREASIRQICRRILILFTRVY